MRTYVPDGFVQALSSVSSDHLVLLDAERCVRYIDDRLWQQLGIAEPAGVGASFLTMLPDELAEPLSRDLDRAWRSPSAIAGEVTVLSQTFGYGIARMCRENGAVIGSVCRFSNLTRQKQLEQNARRQQQDATHITRTLLANELASGIAHELNQPLGTISNRAETCKRMLAAYEGVPAEVVSSLETIRDEALRAGGIIQQFRSLMRKRPAIEEDVPVHELVASAQDLMLEYAEAANVSLRTEIDANVGTVLGDAVLLEQVLMNLLRNAVEAMSEGDSPRRVVTISACESAEEEAVAICVRDTGPGISAAVFDQLFHPFVTTKSNGLGIGLHLCQSIVESHSGRLTARNCADGGAEFCLILPNPVGKV